jgi:transposase
MRTRRRFTSEFKAKVALEAIQGLRTIAELATKHELHPNLITQWKRQATEKLGKVFDDKGFEVQANRDAEVTKLHAKIGQLVVERDFLANSILWNDLVLRGASLMISISILSGEEVYILLR